MQDEKLLVEDQPSSRLVDKTPTLGQEISQKMTIKKEIMHLYTEEMKVLVDVPEVEKSLPTDNKCVKITNKCHVCEEAFSSSYDMKQHMMNHRKPFKQVKPKVEFDHDLSGHTSAVDKVSRFEIRSQKQHFKKGTKKNADGKYECIKCGYQHIRQKIVLFHGLYEHEGVTWDCTLCSKKYNNPYKLKNHFKMKHKETEALKVKESSNKYVEIKKIQQILNGNKQISATPKKKKEHFTFSRVKNKSSNERKIAKKGRKKEGQFKKKETNYEAEIHNKVRNQKLKVKDCDKKVIGTTDIDPKKMNNISKKIKKKEMKKLKPEKKIKPDLKIKPLKPVKIKPLQVWLLLQKEKQKRKRENTADVSA